MEPNRFMRRLAKFKCHEHNKKNNIATDRPNDGQEYAPSPSMLAKQEWIAQKSTMEYSLVMANDGTIGC